MKKARSQPDECQETEMLILPDGTIFAHNITPVIAGILAQLNPSDLAMRRRAARTLANGAQPEMESSHHDISN